MKMNRKILGAAALIGSLICGCTGKGAAEETAVPETPTAAATEAAVATEATVTEAAPETAAAPEDPAEEIVVRIGALKGPTSIGLLEMIGREESNYSFTMETQADALLPEMVSGNLDIALVPANVASVLYNKTQGGVAVIDINTLGVLYMVSGDPQIQSISDLDGRTICLTGKGTTPEFVLRHVMAGAGIECNVEYKSEPTEVVAALAEDPQAVGMLPQPFATVACRKNEALRVVLDMTAEWEQLDAESALVTGVTIVRRDFLEEHPDLVEAFLREHGESSEYAKENTAETAERMVAQGILENAAVAEEAIPYCHLVCIEGQEMQTKLASYLEVLYNEDPASVGGALPGEDFYYCAD